MTTTTTTTATTAQLYAIYFYFMPRFFEKGIVPEFIKLSSAIIMVPSMFSLLCAMPSMWSFPNEKFCKWCVSSGALWSLFEIGFTKLRTIPHLRQICPDHQPTNYQQCLVSAVYSSQHIRTRHHPSNLPYRPYRSPLILFMECLKATHVLTEKVRHGWLSWFLVGIGPDKNHHCCSGHC